MLLGFVFDGITRLSGRGVLRVFGHVVFAVNHTGKKLVEYHRPMDQKKG